MNFILCLQGKHKAKVFSKGDSMESLLMATIVDKVATEKGLSIELALKFVAESLCDGYDSLNCELEE